MFDKIYFVVYVFLLLLCIYYDDFNIKSYNVNDDDKNVEANKKLLKSWKCCFCMWMSREREKKSGLYWKSICTKTTIFWFRLERKVFSLDCCHNVWLNFVRLVSIRFFLIRHFYCCGRIAAFWWLYLFVYSVNKKYSLAWFFITS